MAIFHNIGIEAIKKFVYGLTQDNPLHTGHTFVESRWADITLHRYIVGNGGIKLDKGELLDKAYDFINQCINDGHTFGAWVDNGSLYVDRTSSTDSIEEAMQWAKERNELAIYDSVLDECLTVSDYFDSLQLPDLFVEDVTNV